MKKSLIILAVAIIGLTSCNQEKENIAEPIKKVAPAPKPVDAKTIALVPKTEILKNTLLDGIPVHKRVYQEIKSEYEYTEFLTILWDIPLDVWDKDGIYLEYPEYIQAKDGGWNIAYSGYEKGDTLCLKGNKPKGYTWFEDRTGKQMGERTYISQSGKEWKKRQ